MGDRRGMGGVGEGWGRGGGGFGSQVPDVVGMDHSCYILYIMVLTGGSAVHFPNMVHNYYLSTVSVKDCGTVAPPPPPP